MKLIIALITVGLFITATPGQAAYITGQDLLKSCMQGDEKGMEQCRHYIGAIVDYHIMMQALSIAPPIDFCIPEQETLTGVTAKVAVFFEQNPQHGPFIAAPAVAMALSKMYPCQR